ncbi:hypothetical protein ABZ504_52890 [Streptomyces mirabilis]|uniref:hypothetical protein n=1 Tax=Streptomyces mirabilis TaxID=68239 RepID=UPI0033FC0A76
MCPTRCTTMSGERAEVLARPPGCPEELARLLVLEQLISHTGAEIHWLEDCGPPAAPAPHGRRGC